MNESPAEPPNSWSAIWLPIILAVVIFAFGVIFTALCVAPRLSL